MSDISVISEQSYPIRGQMEEIQQVIDVHFHIWDVAVLTIPTVDLFKGQLKKKYTLEDYKKATKGIPITQSIYTEVDVIKEQHKQETEMIIDICNDDTNQIVGATIAGDLNSEDFASYIQPYAKQRVVKSVRHNFFAADPKITQSKRFRDNVRLLGDLDLMFDIIIPAEKITVGVELVKACPDTTFVIDHCGACPILSDANRKKQWRDGITAYAQLPNTLCKVSECGFMNPDYRWKVPDVRDIIHHCIASFGNERIVYGTNWPICEMTGTVQRWVEALEEVLKDFPDHYPKQLFYENASRYYHCALSV